MIKNKKAQFAMMHPGILFLLGIIIGALLVYYLVSKNIIPLNLLPF